MVLNHVKHFFFNIMWRIYVKLSRCHHEQEFLMVSLGRWKSYHFEHCVKASIDLILESTLLSVVNNGEVRVADPSINQLLVEFSCLIDCLVSSLIILICVKFSCSIGR